MNAGIPKALFAEFGIPTDYGSDPPLRRYAEAPKLEDVGSNIVGRPQSLTPAAAMAWHDMVEMASADAITLLLVSGFRSIAYQGELIRNKLSAGQSIADILTVNVAPGFSQHHTGNAIDIATPGTKPLLEEFENSVAFAWLQKNAAQFGFVLSYPRDNAEGIVYEPWHWYRNTDQPD